VLGTITLTYASGQAGEHMSEAWKQWEGQVVDGEFYLRQYLGGCEHSAVFLTEHGERGLQKAAIKLIPADPGNAELQLSRWEAGRETLTPSFDPALSDGTLPTGRHGAALRRDGVRR